jgi:hypothetical protein
MKLIIKYIWSLVLVPFLLFVKGDLSFDTLVELTHVNKPIEVVQAKVNHAVANEGDVTFSIPVKIITINDSFSGNGLKVKLFDADYNQIAESQIIDKVVKFTVPFKYAGITNFHVVSVETAEEITIESLQKIKVSLEINEAHLSDKK